MNQLAKGGLIGALLSFCGSAVVFVVVWSMMNKQIEKHDQRWEQMRQEQAQRSAERDAEWTAEEVRTEQAGLFQFGMDSWSRMVILGHDIGLPSDSHPTGAKSPDFQVRWDRCAKCGTELSPDDREQLEKMLPCPKCGRRMLLWSHPDSWPADLRQWVADMRNQDANALSCEMWRDNMWRYGRLIPMVERAEDGFDEFWMEYADLVTTGTAAGCWPALQLYPPSQENIWAMRKAVSERSEARTRQERRQRQSTLSR